MDALNAQIEILNREIRQLVARLGPDDVETREILELRRQVTDARADRILLAQAGVFGVFIV
jgi:hypothetical protein